MIARRLRAVRAQAVFNPPALGERWREWRGGYPADAEHEPHLVAAITWLARAQDATPDGGIAWTRVNLGFVSAYLLVRGGEAALVDTGVAGSAEAIEASLGQVGLGWDAVAHVVLTHHHGDHQGSVGEVLQRAPGASTYAGTEDVPSIVGAPSVKAVEDGDDVFGLRIITTPGHTEGSISVLDPIAGVLVAGDALRVDGGKPGLPGAQFTVDMDEARRSIVKLGGLTFETLLVGHGDPIESGASALVAELGAGG